MNKKGVFAAFSAVTAISVVLRIFEMLSLTEYDTGFIKLDKTAAYYTVLAVMALLLCLALALAVLNRPAPEKSKSFNLFTSIFSLFLGIAAVIDVQNQKYISVPAFLKTACVVLAFATAVFFALFAIRPFIHFRLLPELSVLPVLFFTVKAATVFISCSFHSVLSETVFDIGAYSFCMLFFLELARSVNKLTSEKSNTKKLLILGILSSYFSFCASLPRLITAIVNKSALHDSGFAGFLPLFMGFYIASVIFTRITFDPVARRKMGIYYVSKH
ncbi:MAG: hypothetical protein IKZ47_02925 [Clostridia bacterium]|nr:hypothetical protein [Clostridia bacterium]